MSCGNDSAAPAIWAIVVGAIVLMIFYGIVSSNLKSRRRRRAREKALPFVEETIRGGHRYHLFMSDGREFRDVELVGTSDPDTGRFALGGWEGMLVLLQTNGKRVFVRQTSVRCVEEA